MPAPYRARIVGTRHVAAAGHYLAAQAAFQVLEAGGNAIDAGCAGGMALGVLQSEFVSFGGVAPIMIRLADGGEVVTITGLGHWPKAASLEVFRRDHDGHIPDGILSTVIPAAPDAWITALERHGTMSFAEVAAAAIRFARDGFPVNALLNQMITDRAEGYGRWPANAEIYLPGGQPPRLGELFRQEDLGRTIQHMADEEGAAAAKGGREAGLEAARHAFYKGDIAAAMVTYHAQNGGWMTADDLAQFRVEVLPPLKTTFGDVDYYACGPWCQGPVVPQALNILDGFDLKALGHNQPAYIHTVVEALKLAYADRHHYYGDPNFVDVPMEALLSAEHSERRRKMIDASKAAPGMPAPGSPEELGVAAAGAAAEATRQEIVDGLDTSYVAVVDSQGNLFSATPSDASSTSPVIPGLGFVPSSRGTQSWADPRVPACMAPGKRPRLTPNPAISHPPGTLVDALRHAGQRRAGAGHGAGADQHRRLRHGAAGGGRKATLRHRQLPAVVGNPRLLSGAPARGKPHSQAHPGRPSDPRPRRPALGPLGVEVGRGLRHCARRQDRHDGRRRRSAPAQRHRRLVRGPVPEPFTGAHHDQDRPRHSGGAL